MSAIVRAPRLPEHPVDREPTDSWGSILLQAVVIVVGAVLLIFGMWSLFTPRAHADDTTPPPSASTVRVSALPVKSATPTVTPSPELLPATSTTLGIDAATIIPSTTKPVKLANTGGPDALRIGLFGGSLVGFGALVLWLRKRGER